MTCPLFAMSEVHFVRLRYGGGKDYANEITSLDIFYTRNLNSSIILIHIFIHTSTL